MGTSPPSGEVKSRNWKFLDYNNDAYFGAQFSCGEAIWQWSDLLRGPRPPCTAADLQAYNFVFLVCDVEFKLTS